MRKLLFLIMLLPMLVLGQTLPISVRATNGNAFGGLTLNNIAVATTNMFATGTTLWVDAVNGTNATAVRGYQNRPWLTFGLAVSNALPGDVVRVRPGDYTNLFMVKMNAGTHIVGEGLGTRLWNKLSRTNGVPGGLGPMIQPGNNCSIGNLWIDGLPTVTVVQNAAHIGTLAVDGVQNQPFTNVLIYNIVTGTNCTSGLYLRHTNVSITVRDCEFYGSRTPLLLGAIVDTVFPEPVFGSFYDSKFITTGTNGIGASGDFAKKAANIATGGTNWFFNCTFGSDTPRVDVPEETAYETNSTALFVRGGPTNQIYLVGCHLYSANTNPVGNSFDIYNTDGASVTVLPGTTFNRAKTYGGYNERHYGDGNGLTNGSPALATNNATATDGMALVKRGNNLKLETVGGDGGSGTNLWFGSIEDSNGIYTTNSIDDGRVALRLFPQGGGVPMSLRVSNYAPERTDPPFDYWPQMFWHVDGSFTIPQDSGSRIQWKQDGTLNIIGATITGSTLSSYLPLAGGTMTGQLINSLNGAASTPPVTMTGTWFTGGSATTTKPQLLIEPAGTTSTGWSTSGTALGVNAASGFAGSLLDLSVNGVSKFKVRISAGQSEGFIDYMNLNIGPLSIGATPATSGAIRIGNNAGFYGRNAANSANIEMLYLFTDNKVYIGDTSAGITLRPATGNVQIAGTGNLLLDGGLVGKTDASSASAGNVGQIISSLVASGSAVSLTTATGADVTSISLTAGDWDVEANVNFTATGATITATTAGISATSATLPTDGSEAYTGAGVGIAALSFSDTITLPRKRISISSTTPIYMVAKSTFTLGTVAGYGQINARRVR